MGDSHHIPFFIVEQLALPLGPPAKEKLSWANSVFLSVLANGVGGYGKGNKWKGSASILLSD